jgi:hypothetical protein
MLSLTLGYGLNLLLALAAIIGFWGVGRICWRALIKDIKEDSLSTLFQFSIGSWLIWTSVLLLGLVGGLQAKFAWLLFSISSFLGLAQLFLNRARLSAEISARLRGGVEGRGWFELVLYFLCSVIILLALVGALTPPASQDALVHHLALPKTFIREGRIVELPYNYFSYFPAGMEMLFLYGLLLRGPAVATLLHLSFGLATFALILAGGRSLGMGSRARLIAATAFLSAPTVWMEMTWAYIDLALTFYAALSLIALLHYRQDRKLGWIFLTGFSLGGALSIKYTALYIACILLLLLLFVLREHKQSIWAVIHRASTLLIIALLVSCPWFIRNLLYTGNPLFPFFLNLIPSHNPGWDAERARLVLLVLSRYGGENKTLLDYLLVPFKLSFLARYGSDKYFQGMIGPFFFFSIPLLVAIRRTRIEIRYLFGFSIIFYLFWLLSAQEIRYLLPAIPPLAMAIASTYDLFETWNNWREKAKKAAVILATLIFLFNTGMIFYYFNKFEYGGLFLGKVSAADFLRKKFDYYKFYEYINENTPADSRIFLIQASNQPYYLERDYFSDSVFEDFTIKRIVYSSGTTAEIKSKLKEIGVTHLLFRPKILFDYNNTPFNKEKHELMIRFLKEDCQLLMLNKEQTFALFVINR